MKRFLKVFSVNAAAVNFLIVFYTKRPAAMKAKPSACAAGCNI